MAAEGVPKPRVNGSILPKCTGKTVSIVAKYIRVDGGMTLVLETSDGQTLNAKLLQPLHEPPTPFVEVVGQVGYDCSITVDKIVNYGSDFDLGTYNEAVKLTQQFPQYFPQGS
jgi:replication factor A3